MAGFPLRCSWLTALLMGCGYDTHLEPLDSRGRLGAWVPEPSATILNTGISFLANPTQSVVSDTATWRTLWTETWGPAAPTLPVIDFVTNSVLVIGTGKRAGPGYAVKIDSLVIYTAGAVLFVTASQPGGHCDVTTGTSAPVHMVHAPGHPPIIEWHVDTVREDCGP